MAERRHLGSSKASRCQIQILRNVVHHTDQRENHQRKEELNETNDHRKLIIEQADRLMDQTGRHKHLIHNALLTENNHPAERADNRTREHREDGKRHQHTLVLGILGNVIGGRKSQTGTDNRADQAQANASPKYLLKVSTLKQGEIIRQGERSTLIEKRLENEGEQRNQHKYRKKQTARQNK